MGSVIKRLGSGALGVLAAAVAALLFTIACSFVVYALLRFSLSMALAAAITAVVFAVFAAALAIALPGILGATPAPNDPVRRHVQPEDTRMALEIGTATLGFITDVMLQRRIVRDSRRGSPRSTKMPKARDRR